MPPTLEPPVDTSLPDTTEAKPDSISEAYDRALKGVQEPKTKGADPADAKEAAKPDSKLAKEAEAKPATKPASALDAALGDQAPSKKADAPDPVADEIPANAPARLLRDALKRREAEVHEWKTKAEKASTPDPAIKGQIETLTRERDELRAENVKARDAITALDVRYEPGYQAKFVEGRKEAVSRAAVKLKAFGGDGEALTEALGLPEGRLRSTAIKDALGELDADDRVKVMAAIERVETLDEEGAAILKDPQQAWAKMTQQQQEQAQRAHEDAQKNKQAIFDRVVKTLPEKAKLLSLVESTAEGAEDWNSGVAGAHDYAKRLLGPDATLEEITTAAVKGARYDFVENLVLEERASHRAETAQLREQLAKYEEAEPGFRGTSKTPKTDKLDKTPGELYAETLDQLSAKV